LLSDHVGLILAARAARRQGVCRTKEGFTVNPVTVLVGVAAIGYGVYTAWARRTRPEQFRKLEPMKKLWGEKAGPIVHIVGYTVAPIVIGIVLVVRGLQGAGLF